jgi:hypothetical protein
MWRTVKVSQKELFMSLGFTTVHGVADDREAVDGRRQIGAWEVHSWGTGRLPGMAVLSAITTLQVGATLAEAPADKIAMNDAAEYLIRALQTQLKTFQQTLRAD